MRRATKESDSARTSTRLLCKLQPHIGRYFSCDSLIVEERESFYVSPRRKYYRLKAVPA